VPFGEREDGVTVRCEECVHGRVCDRDSERRHCRIGASPAGADLGLWNACSAERACCAGTIFGENSETGRFLKTVSSPTPAASTILCTSKSLRINGLRSRNLTGPLPPPDGTLSSTPAMTWAQGNAAGAIRLQNVSTTKSIRKPIPAHVIRATRPPIGRR
jgi:hypothetical protein